MSPVLAGRFFSTEPLGEPKLSYIILKKKNYLLSETQMEVGSQSFDLPKSTTCQSKEEISASSVPRSWSHPGEFASVSSEVLLTYQGSLETAGRPSGPCLCQLLKLFGGTFLEAVRHRKSTDLEQKKETNGL